MVERNAQTGAPGAPDEDAVVQAVLDAARDRSGGDRRPAALAGFCRALLQRVAATELAMTDPAGVAPGILEAFDLLADRGPGTVAIRVDPVPASMFGPEGGSTAVDVATDDRPLLFSTVIGALERNGLSVQRFSHPIVGVERDQDRRIVDVGTALGSADQEVLIHVEVAQALDDEARDWIRAEVSESIDDLLAAERDLDAMRTETADAGAALQRRGPARYRPEACTEAAEFCRWLLAGNFLFVGTGHEPGDHTLGTYHHDGAALAPVAPAELLGTEPIAVRRSLRTSRVSRPERLAELLVADLDDDGTVTGALRVLGLTTLRGRSERPSGTPWIRAKLAATLDQEKIVVGSHDETMIRALFDSLPWDTLLVADDAWMHDTLVQLIEAQQTGRSCVRLLPEPASDALTVVVAVPQEDFRTGLPADLEAVVQDLLHPASIETEAELSASGMTMLSYVAGLEPGELDLVDGDALVDSLTEACRSWSERLARELTRSVGMSGPEIAQRWLGRLPAPYREATAPATAAADLVALDRVDGSGNVTLRLAPGVPEGTGDWHHLRVAVGGTPLELSRFIPVLESVGLVVAEEMTFSLDGPRLHPSAHPVEGAPASVLDLLVARRDHRPIEADGSRLADAVLAAWSGDADVDRLNELVLSAGLAWPEVAVLRAYARYLSQVATGTRPGTVFDALADNPAAATALWRRFEDRFRPAQPGGTSDADWDEQSRTEALTCCDDVARLDQDRILRRLLGLVDATVRTNLWATTRSGAVVLSFAGDQLPGQARPVTWREIWVSTPDVEGIHLRTGPVARGGIRWSDRDGDVRTEVLQLMQAQDLKNALIVPTGAKGGFVLRRRPDAAADLPGAVRAAYSTFVRSLLDVTDDRVDGATVRRPGIRAADGPDTYLVVAADRGTAAFSDLANSFSEERGFWLGDAFASGGSDGYDHKALGVTARGAWVSVTEHFDRLGLDTATDPFTVVGVGDMSGDVFGNGMLLSHAIRLVAAFDHRHVFLDPDPDPERSWAERRRLFELPRSSWADYDPAALGPGAMVVSRTTKRVALTTQVQALLGVDEAELAMPDLLRAVLCTRADLLYFGGIGTYVKATSESNGGVGDPVNDEIRVDAEALRIRVVGEGANLGMTPAARVEYAMAGGLVNSDAIDNSAGVDSSDHEVNLKILLGIPERAGVIDRERRNELLESVVDDVVGRVLSNVAKQNRALTRGVEESRRSLEPYLSLLFALEASNAVDRDIHALPSGRVVRARREGGDGLYRPELAVVLAATKTWLADEVLGSDLPDKSPLGELIEGYFPAELTRAFPDAVAAHPLRRVIIASRLANEIVDRLGATWVPEVARRSGQSPATVMAAYWMARETARIGPWWRAIDGAALADRDLLWNPAQEVIDALAGDYLRRGVARAWRWSEIERNAVAAGVLARWRPDGSMAEDATRPGEHPEERAERLRRLALAPGLAEVAEVAGIPPERAVGAFVDAGRRFGLDRLTWAVLACALDPADTWSQRHRESLLFDLDRLRRAAAGVLLGGVDLTDLSLRLQQLDPRVDEAIEQGAERLDPLAVVCAELWLVVEEEAGGIPRA
jgi:glutamate dehydrogenase